MIWCIPTWCGDYRLEEKGEECVLTIESPTLKEIPVINAFVKLANEKGWTESSLSLPERSEKGLDVNLKLNVGIQTAAKELVMLSLGKSEAWTAVRSESGKVSLVDGVPAAVVVADTKAAVTVRTPKRGCPAPEPAARRAAEVLQLFSTQTQWASFLKKGFMPLIGNYTGQRYFLYHRDEAAKRNFGHNLLDENGREVCVWDASVPAEEEMLGIKLAVEHREHWMRSKHDDFQDLPGYTSF
jgi:hypothetical protein